MTAATTTDPKLVPSPLASTLTMASLTWKRMLRGRALWVSLAIAMLPIAYAGATGGSRGIAGDEIFLFEILVAAVLAPMFVAASIGEEIEDRTTTYLWSRPVPRWSIVVGKLVCLVPVTAAVAVASWALAAQVAWHAWPALRSCAALVVAVAALSVISAGVATLAPRHGMALTICYVLFFDSPLGVLPATLRELSVTHQVRALSGIWATEIGIQTPLIALALLTLVWGSIAAIRIRKLEA
ncbi:MAG: ABC transporter permease subunit [Myxococcales bacterium]|nr:ABC transporter permease subunit [Myxococcales bacterium]